MKRLISILFSCTVASTVIAFKQDLPVKSQGNGEMRLVPQFSNTAISDIFENKAGTRLITHDSYYAPKLWDAKSLRLLGNLGGASNSVHEVKFSPDGKYIATRSSEDILLWDSTKGNLIWTIKITENDQFYSLDFSPDSSKLAFVTKFRKLKVIPTLSPKSVKVYEGIQDYTGALTFVGNDKIACAGEGEDLLIWDLAQTNPKFKFNLNQDLVRWMKADPSGTTILAMLNNLKVVAIDALTGKELYRKESAFADRDEYLANDFSSRAVGVGFKQTFFATPQGNLQVCDLKTGALVKELKGTGQPLAEITVSENGTKAIGFDGEKNAVEFDFISMSSSPIPIDSSDRVGISLSSNLQTAWLGFLNGDIRSFDLKSRKVTAEQLGQISGAHKIRFLGKDTLQYYGFETYSEASIAHLQEFNFTRLYKKGEVTEGFRVDQAMYCSTGRYAFNLNQEQRGKLSKLVVRDMLSNKLLLGPTAAVVERANWIPNTQSILVQGLGNDFSIFDCALGAFVKSWKHKSEGAWCIPGPDGALIAVCNGGQLGFMFDTEKGSIHSTLEHVPDVAFHYFKFSPSGNLFAGGGQNGIVVWNVKTGKVVFKYNISSTDSNVAALEFSSDERTLFVGGEKFRSFDLEKKTQISEFSCYYMLWNNFGQLMNPERTRILMPEGNYVQVADIKTGQEVFRIMLKSPASTAVYSPDGKRILTSDGADHITIWDAEPVTELVTGKPTKVGKKLGNVAQTNDGSLFVMDPQGRYDAKDPSDVRAAIYVKEWEGGLETLEVSQFKSIYWDPGLLEKILGNATTKPRDVPSLANLRLFPEVSFKPSGKSRMDVAIKPRDNGGIGRVQVFINGKMVEEKQGTGYFTLDLEKLQQFMLPENLLPKGQGNLLGVKVTNEDGTLASELKLLDIGIPAGLMVPEVKLYALFCGVSDYVGESDDLGAPASDAQKLEEAVRKTAGKLLDSRIETTLLTTKGTNPDQRPTRANIMKWLADTQQKATSSDIVLIFFAGHGIDKLGSKSGYFFLTSESQPSEITEASLASMSISGEDLKSMLSKISASKQVVVLDTCHSGAAGTDLVGESRSVSGDYARAFEAIKDATGTWMLAGSAADQRSYESVNVDHGMLTYALLEAIDRGNAAGLRQAPSGELFVDVERWLQYAAARVESLKNEVGLSGLQRPEFKRSKAATTFDLGVMDESNRGFLGLKAPKPVVLLGSFQMEEEDPAGLEDVVKASFKDSTKIKAWFDASKHPNVYRVAGSYTTSGENIELKIFLQKFDALGQRKTLETFTVKGSSKALATLGTNVLSEVEKRIMALEEAKVGTP